MVDRVRLENLLHWVPTVSGPSRAKVHWGRLDAERLITDAPPAGTECRTPEMYYKTVLKGARKIADECPEM